MTRIWARMEEAETVQAKPIEAPTKAPTEARTPDPVHPPKAIQGAPMYATSGYRQTVSRRRREDAAQLRLF